MDGDSLYLALSEEHLEDVVLPAKRDTWNAMQLRDCTDTFSANATDNIFPTMCCNKYKKNDKKEPRLIQEEFRCSRSLCLCTESYCCCDWKRTKYKFSSRRLNFCRDSGKNWKTDFLEEVSQCRKWIIELNSLSLYMTKTGSLYQYNAKYHPISKHWQTLSDSAQKLKLCGQRIRIENGNTKVSSTNQKRISLRLRWETLVGSRLHSARFCLTWYIEGLPLPPPHDLPTLLLTRPNKHTYLMFFEHKLNWSTTQCIKGQFPGKKLRNSVSVLEGQIRKQYTSTRGTFSEETIRIIKTEFVL